MQLLTLSKTSISTTSGSFSGSTRFFCIGMEDHGLMYDF